MFTKNSAFSEFLADIESWGGCTESNEWCKRLKKRRPNMTLGEAIAELSLDPKTDHQSWAMGSLMIYDGRLDKEVRMAFIEKIVDPMTAAMLYVKLKNLTDEEDEILLNKFKGKLPELEKGLKEGIIVRQRK